MVYSYPVRDIIELALIDAINWTVGTIDIEFGSSADEEERNQVKLADYRRMLLMRYGYSSTPTEQRLFEMSHPSIFRGEDDDAVR